MNHNLLLELQASSRLLELVTYERDFAQLVEVPDALDKQEELRQLLRDIARPVCVVCDCLLVGLVDVEADRPPHCQDCWVEDDQDITWENETRPYLKRRIESALAEGE